jgi:hypothetical protein
MKKPPVCEEAKVLSKTVNQWRKEERKVVYIIYKSNLWVRENKATLELPHSNTVVSVRSDKQRKIDLTDDDNNGE